MNGAPAPRLGEAGLSPPTRQHDTGGQATSGTHRDRGTPLPRSVQSKATVRCLVDNAANSVVQIRTVFAEPSSARDSSDLIHETSMRSKGTGFVIGQDGIILTAEHVLRSAERATVTLRDGSSYVATRVVAHPRLDLAIVLIDADRLQPIAQTGLAAALRMPVVALTGHCSNDTACHRIGIVTDPSVSLQDQIDPARRRNYGGLIETTVRLGPGYSGGPLIDTSGRLVGINIAVAETPEGEPYCGYAIPFDVQTRRAVDDIVNELKGDW